jgi:hypothetical protein
MTSPRLAEAARALRLARSPCSASTLPATPSTAASVDSSSTAPPTARVCRPRHRDLRRRHAALYERHGFKRGRLYQSLDLEPGPASRANGAARSEAKPSEVRVAGLRPAGPR